MQKCPLGGWWPIRIERCKVRSCVVELHPHILRQFWYFSHNMQALHSFYNQLYGSSVFLPINRPKILISPDIFQKRDVQGFVVNVKKPVRSQTKDETKITIVVIIFKKHLQSQPLVRMLLGWERPLFFYPSPCFQLPDVALLCHWLRWVLQPTLCS